MVMYSVSTNTSVGALFMAGVIPGLAAGPAAAVSTWLVAQEEQLSAAAEGEPGANAGIWRSATSVWGLLLIVVVMGGIYTGIFTPTEAAAMSAVYAFFVPFSSTRTWA